MADLESVFVHKQLLCQHFLPTPVWTGALAPSCFDFFHSQTLSFVHATLPEPPKTALFWEKKSSHTFISKLSHSHRTLSISFFFLESSWHYPLYFCPECFPSICFGWAVSLFILLEEMKVTEVLVPWGEIMFIKWKKEGKRWGWGVGGRKLHRTANSPCRGRSL